MRISLLVPAPFETISGGYGYDRRIVAELRHAGHDVAVIQMAGQYPIADETARDAACVALDKVPQGVTVVIDGLGLPAFTGLDDALAARRIVGLIHHPASLETGLDPRDANALGTIERRLLPRLNRVIVTSETTGTCVTQDFGVLQERLSVVVPGTDAAPRGMGSGGPTCQILAVGNLTPRKGHILLLQALSRLFDLDWHLTIVGSDRHDPVHARGLLAAAEELNIVQRVTFAGELTGDALEARWRQTDLFALATYYEGYGMAVAEALKRGIPVVITDGGTVGTLVCPDAGLICPVGDRDQLSKSLRRLIYSTQLRQEMADAAWTCGTALPSWETQAQLFAAAIG